jgi:hypothetical protein
MFKDQVLWRPLSTMTTLLYSLRQRKRICDILKLAMSVWPSGYTTSCGLNKLSQGRSWLAERNNWRIKDLLVQTELTIIPTS